MKPTVSIGIPVYNESANITYVLDDLSRQKSESYILEHIIILSDGSTDGTQDLIKKYPNPRIMLIENKTRVGVAEASNMIFEKMESDICVFLNGDIAIQDTGFIDAIIQPIVEGAADMTSCSLDELPPHTFFEKIIYVGMQYKKNMFLTYKDGSNLFNCRGPARAFSKKLYKEMRLVRGLADDMYSYLYCVEQGYRFVFVPNASIAYKLPDHFTDHVRQSIRFFQSAKALKKRFDPKFLQEHYFVPKLFFLRETTKAFMQSPFLMTLYIIVTVCTSLVGQIPFIPDARVHWTLAKSSKKLHTSS